MLLLPPIPAHPANVGNTAPPKHGNKQLNKGQEPAFNPTAMGFLVHRENLLQASTQAPYIRDLFPFGQDTLPLLRVIGTLRG